MSPKIGVIDSGWGGVVLSKYLHTALPQVKFFVALDQKHFPYGSKSVQQMRECVIATVQFLQSKKVQGVVLACNTASIVVEELREKFPTLFFVDMITPTMELVFNTNFFERTVVVLMTQCMKDSNLYQEKIAAMGSDKKGFIYQACPELVNLAEIGKNSIELLQEKFVQYISPPHPCYVLLACTHFYGFLNSLREWDPTVMYLDVPKFLVQAVQKQIFNTPTSLGYCKLYTNNFAKLFSSRVQREFLKKVSVEAVEW